MYVNKVMFLLGVVLLLLQCVDKLVVDRVERRRIQSLLEQLQLQLQLQEEQEEQEEEEDECE